jgi:UDP-N-acetylglucosamine--N-acetylmuramyl-(pentapeptide) pyrophosphoryl-undecaprenol N-acetylglucosamine transferase
MSTLLVASTGGHLKELHYLYRRLSGVTGPYRWVTFDTPQSRSLLAGETVDFVPFVGPRDPINTTRNLAVARRILHSGDFDTVVSTGAAVALPFCGLARTRRLRCHYIEGAARVDGPSLTGRLVSRVPGVQLYAQYRRRWGGSWRYGGSVFDAFERAPVSNAKQNVVGKVVVSLGTNHGYGFPRLIRRLRAILPAETDVLWQTSDTDVSGLGIKGHYAIPEQELTEAIREADVVVSHAGVGTALAAFGVGKCPLLVPRRASFREHVDDHQRQIAGELADRGLSLSVEADDLSYDDILAAAAYRVATIANAPTFVMSKA